MPFDSERGQILFFDFITYKDMKTHFFMTFSVPHRCLCIWFDEHCFLIRIRLLSLSGWGFGAARAEIVPVWLSRLWCCNSNRSNFQRRFYSDGSGRGEKAAASTAPPLFFFFVVMRWGAGWVGLELELHNGCLSELIKRKKKKRKDVSSPCVFG